MPYVADAHSWVYYLTGKLSRKANGVFISVENGEDVMYVSTIALAECLYLSNKGKISLDVKELFNKFEISLNFIPVSFNFEVVKLLPSIKIKELHDRIIVATSKLLNAKLITKDREIRNSGLVETIW